MKRKRLFAETMSVMASPSVEVMGREAVRIEAHRGISEFSPEEIVIRLASGCIVIKGAELTIRAMSESFITVSGRIDSTAYRE